MTHSVRQVNYHNCLVEFSRRIKGKEATLQNAFVIISEIHDVSSSPVTTISRKTRMNNRVNFKLIREFTAEGARNIC